jgi:hypothetical protein
MNIHITSLLIVVCPVKKYDRIRRDRIKREKEEAEAAATIATASSTASKTPSGSKRARHDKFDMASAVTIWEAGDDADTTPSTDTIDKATGNATTIDDNKEDQKSATRRSPTPTPIPSIPAPTPASSSSSSVPPASASSSSSSSASTEKLWWQQLIPKRRAANQARDSGFLSGQTRISQEAKAVKETPKQSMILLPVIISYVISLM